MTTLERAKKILNEHPAAHDDTFLQSLLKRREAYGPFTPQNELLVFVIQDYVSFAYPGVFE